MTGCYACLGQHARRHIRHPAVCFQERRAIRLGSAPGQELIADNQRPGFETRRQAAGEAERKDQAGVVGRQQRGQGRPRGLAEAGRGYCEAFLGSGPQSAQFPASWRDDQEPARVALFLLRS